MKYHAVIRNKEIDYQLGIYLKQWPWENLKKKNLRHNNFSKLKIHTKICSEKHTFKNIHRAPMSSTLPFCADAAQLISASRLLSISCGVPMKKYLRLMWKLPNNLYYQDHVGRRGNEWLKEMMTQFLYQKLMKHYFKRSFSGAPTIKMTLLLLLRILRRKANR